MLLLLLLLCCTGSDSDDGCLLVIWALLIAIDETPPLVRSVNANQIAFDIEHTVLQTFVRNVVTWHGLMVPWLSS